MKRFLFGIVLTVVGLAYSLFCFIWAVREPWYYKGVSGVFGSLLGNELMTPFLFFSLLLFLGLVICCAEAYRRK